MSNLSNGIINEPDITQAVQKIDKAVELTSQSISSLQEIVELLIEYNESWVNFFKQQGITV